MTLVTQRHKFIFMAITLMMLNGFFCHESLAQDFSGAFEGMQQSDEPIQIEANKLEVEDSNGQAFLTGNVTVVQGSTILKTQKLTVWYERNNQGENGAIQKLKASGKLAIRSGDQKVTADQGAFDLKGEKVKLTGNVIISQGVNVVAGCILNVDLKSGAATLEPCKKKNKRERIKMLFDPKSAKN